MLHLLGLPIGWWYKKKFRTGRESRQRTTCDQVRNVRAQINVSPDADTPSVYVDFAIRRGERGKGMVYTPSNVSIARK
jgi:hypothetical protein